MATGQHMPRVARSPTSADPDGTDLSQPDGRTGWCLCAPRMVLRGMVCAPGTLSSIWLLTTAHMFTILLCLEAGAAPSTKAVGRVRGRRCPPGWPAHAAAPPVANG